MSLKQRLTEDMKAAMRAKDSERLGTIRLLLAACKQKEVDERVELDVATKPRDLPIGDIAAINNSFGFGGANVAVVFGSPS